jgi:hypothetical protein
MLDTGLDLNGKVLSTNGDITATNVNVTSDLSCSSLPIDLLSFNVEVLEERIELSWISLSESNNAYFNLERSADGINFISLFKIEGAGNSTETKYYSALDDDPFDGASYYRLKQADYDGEMSYPANKSIVFSFDNDIVLQSIQIHSQAKPLFILLKT